MKAEVTISNIYWNKKSLGGFFFRDQAYETLEKLVNGSVLEGAEVLSKLDEQTEDLDIDAIEEDFYSSSIEELAEEYDIELVKEDEDEEDNN